MMTLQKPGVAAVVLLLPWLAGWAPGAARQRPANPYRPVAWTRGNRRIAAGAWESAGGGPALYSKGRWYELELHPTAGLPGASVITTVYWSWSLSRIPPGLEVRLCRETLQTCVNVSGRLSGGTRAFAGRGADERFILAYRVPGSGPMAPVYGGSDHVIVNYSFQR